MAKYTLDRIVDGKTAVLLIKDEESQVTNIPISRLPADVKEGDILELSYNEDGSLHKVMIQKEETENTLKKATSLLEKLKTKNKN